MIKRTEIVYYPLKHAIRVLRKTNKDMRKFTKDLDRRFTEADDVYFGLDGSSNRLKVWETIHNRVAEMFEDLDKTLKVGQRQIDISVEVVYDADDSFPVICFGLIDKSGKIF